MTLAEAIQLAQTFVLPGFFVDDASLNDERRRNEEALALLIDAWTTAPAGEEPFSFDLVRSLADRNRTTCDSYGIERLERVGGVALARALSEDDLIRGVVAMQDRPAEEVAALAGADARDLNVAYVDAPLAPVTLCGFDIETTSLDPERGYLINMGIAFMDLTEDAKPHDGHVAYFGLPALYEEKGVPLARVHKITWSDLAGKTPFREDHRAQEVLLKAFTTYPMVAHNAAFEDSWLKLHLDGYAEARKAGQIVIIDSRDVCRRLDPDVRTLPRESGPARLENWARRRGTLAADEQERHLGLEDVLLMLETMRAEFVERRMFPGQRD